jgi:hypothetical protein
LERGANKDFSGLSVVNSAKVLATLKRSPGVSGLNRLTDIAII